MADQEFVVSEAQANATLAAALRSWLPGQSWSQVRKLVAARRVRVSGSVCLDPARRLTAGEPVIVGDKPAGKPAAYTDVAIRYLDSQVVVVEKPAGMPTLRWHEEKDWPAHRRALLPTLDEILPGLIARREGTTGPSSRRPVRIVHRLDRETSGLLVFARTVPAEQHLGRQFKAHTVQRRYLAIIHGHIQPQTIESRLVRDRGDGRRGSTTLPNIGKNAVTHVRPLEDLGEFQLVECRLETGRTHQIRIHLGELGHPVCGDRVYNCPLFQPPLPVAPFATRLALHATELGFEHPTTAERLHFEMPLPPDLDRLCQFLRKGDG